MICENISEELYSIEKETNKIMGTKTCKNRSDKNNFSHDLKIQEDEKRKLDEQIEVRKDYAGLDRMVFAVLPDGNKEN